MPSPGCREVAHKVFVILRLKIIKLSICQIKYLKLFSTHSDPRLQKMFGHSLKASTFEKLGSCVASNIGEGAGSSANQNKMRGMKLNLIIYKMQGQDEPGICYFCKQADIGSCVTRSLYHKYNDSSNKILRRIEQIVEVGKQKSVAARKYQQMKHLLDENDHLTAYIPSTKSHSELKDLLEYYKFRKFVPIFAKNLDNLTMTEELHVYYYDKLKLYYNQIKKRLNITVDQSSVSGSSNSLITKSEISDEQSQILNEITTKVSKEEARLLQTQSKALEGLLNVLKKNEDRLKKIKSLRTQDCTLEPNPFRDNIQRKSNLISYLASQNRNMAKKNKKIFFKYIEQSKAQRNVEQTSRVKPIKKFVGESSKANLYYESIKLRSNSESIFKLRKDNSKIHAATNERILFRNKAILQKTHRKSCQNLMEKQIIKSLPKVQIQINARPSRSMSSASIGYSNNQNQIMKKQSLKKQIEHGSQIQAVRVGGQKEEKKKRMIIKNPKAEIDQNDNLASITKKKLQELKLKSQRKKDSRK